MFDFQRPAGENIYKNGTKTQLNFMEVFSHIRISIIYVGKVATLTGEGQQQ